MGSQSIDAAQIQAATTSVRLASLPGLSFESNETRRCNRDAPGDAGDPHGLPFDRTEAQICAGPCQGCSIKLLGFLESELDGWETRITDGERPGLAELSQLIRTTRKIGRVLEKANLMQLPLSDSGFGAHFRSGDTSPFANARNPNPPSVDVARLE